MRSLVSGLVLSLAVAACGTFAAAQNLNLPATAVGANLPFGAGYALLTMGNQGPYIVTDARRGKDPGPGDPSSAPRPSGALPMPGPQELLLLVRDSQGVPAFRALAAKKAHVPLIVFKSAHRTNTITDTTIEEVDDAYGSSRSAVPIADVLIHYATATTQTVDNAPAGAPSPSATVFKF